jgi:hypothetical protein
MRQHRAEARPADLGLDVPGAQHEPDNREAGAGDEGRGAEATAELARVESARSRGRGGNGFRRFGLGRNDTQIAGPVIVFHRPSFPQSAANEIGHAAFRFRLIKPKISAAA